eukprot:CAMPEP_0117518238 /NCGR_PEP_ID=MMETSP0784-20121206/32029_1 /TAXON_ID=39447 /ORGANISM="" /LENGTH=90 /DNA_ID=CAMNT_0005314153 /DNA_START=828 /DNA_END=1100 /DNA_ORIENTATION=+
MRLTLGKHRTQRLCIVQQLKAAMDEKDLLRVDADGIGHTIPQFGYLISTGNGWVKHQGATVWKGHGDRQHCKVVLRLRHRCCGTWLSQLL